MPITTCTKCNHAYESGSEEQANEQERLCPSCRLWPPELLVRDDFNVIACNGPIWITLEEVRLRAGTLRPGDRIQSILNTTNTGAGQSSFQPKDWVAEFMGTFEIMVNDHPCKHALFNALDLDGNHLQISRKHRNAYIAFAILGPDLHYTSAAISSRLIICDEINYWSKS